jgi:hypothetical protein
VTFEDQVAELTRQIEELNSQKLLRQQMGVRKKTVTPTNSNRQTRRPIPSDQCPKCIILEDMLSEFRTEIEAVRASPNPTD